MPRPTQVPTCALGAPCPTDSSGLAKGRPTSSLLAGLAVSLFAVNPGAACAVNSSQAPMLKRTPGSSAYRMTTDYLDESHHLASRIVADFTLTTKAEAEDEIVLLSATRQGESSSAPDPFALEPPCKERFGGSEASLGSFSLTESIDLNQLVPTCVPEDLFGVVMDFASFLLVQSARFGVDDLQRPGDEVSFTMDEVRWSRPPSTIEGRIEAVEGSLSLPLKYGETALLQWRPEPWNLAVIRALPNDMKMLLGGVETFWLDVEIDTRDGSLLSGRTVFDKEDFRFWVPFAGEGIPKSIDWPTDGGSSRLRFRLISLRRVHEPE